MTEDEQYMYRCLQLAMSGSGYVAPNPLVGAVLVHQNRIIGEGYHKIYGEAHAEVNCIASVKESDRRLISDSVLYVSLEPCSHYGKTPPCADMIIKNRIPRVVIGCRDPFPEVNGKGVEKLQRAGIALTLGVLEKECQTLNKRFFTFHQQHRPYIVLKWAESSNGAIAGAGEQTARISNPLTNRLVHRWRSEEASILVGTRTALLDDPSLTTRLWPGKNPVRLVIDNTLKLPHSLHLLDKSVVTVIFNTMKDTSPEGHIGLSSGLLYYKINKDTGLIRQLTEGLYRLGLQSVLVEGGAGLLQSFIDENRWDEARVITNEMLFLPGGLQAPRLTAGILTENKYFMYDRVAFYTNTEFGGT